MDQALILAILKLVVACHWCVAAARAAGKWGKLSETDVEEAILAALTARRTTGSQSFKRESSLDAEAQAIVDGITASHNQGINMDTLANGLGGYKRRDVVFCFLHRESLEMLNQSPADIVQEKFAGIGEDYSRNPGMGIVRRCFGLGPAIFAPTSQTSDKAELVGIKALLEMDLDRLPGVIIVVVFGVSKIDASEFLDWILVRIKRSCKPEGICTEPKASVTKEVVSATSFLQCAKEVIRKSKVSTGAVIMSQPELQGKSSGCKDKVDLRLAVLKKVCPDAKLTQADSKTGFEKAMTAKAYDDLCF